MAFDQMKMINSLRKAQNELKKEIIEVEAGVGAVVVQVTGELKIKKITINPEQVDLDDIEELEHWLEIALRDGLAKAQEVAAEKMRAFARDGSEETKDAVVKAIALVLQKTEETVVEIKITHNIAKTMLPKGN